MESKSLVPKLRFPEFRNAPGWEQRPLGSEALFFKGRGISKADIDPNGSCPCIRYGELYTRYGEVIDTVHSRTSAPESELFLSSKNDVIIPASGETKEDIATASCVTLDGVALGGDINVLRTNHNGVFLSYLINGVHRRAIAKVAQGDTVVHLYPSQLAQVLVALPEAPEQNKIAECLTSLDELIAAEGRKLEALRTQKKSLMQNLFPREGETNPCFRFPEFQDAGNWEEKPVGSLIRVGSSRRVHESDWTREGVPFYRARELVALSNGESISPLSISESLYDSNVAQTGAVMPGHLLVTGVGSIGVPYLVKEGDRFYFKDGNIIWLKNDQHEVLGDFLYRLFKSEYVQKQIRTMAGVGTVGTYTIDSAKRTLLPYPTDIEEQHCIAGCLSSLDTLITAQVKKLDTLKLHKQGLMQGLFPAAEEAQASVRFVSGA